MAGDAQEKQPTEILQLGADFSLSLLAGETISVGNISIVVTNALTDAVATGTIFVGGSSALSGNTITGRFTGGADGEIYTVTFKTGQTNLGNQYQATINLVITIAPMGDNLFCNMTEVKRLLGITDTSDDVLLSDLIEAATSYLAKRIGRDVFLRTYVERVYISEDTELVDENFGERSMVLLHHFPVVQVDKIDLIYADGSFTQTLTQTAPLAGIYDWTADGKLFIKHSYSFYEAPDYNVITYRAGFSKIPEDLREAAKRVVAFLYRWRGREGLSSERIGDYSWAARQLSGATHRFEFDDAMIEGIVQRYKRVDMLL